MDNVADMAHEHPDVPVNIWVDVYGMGGHPDRIMGALNGLGFAPNITFKALDSIPAYTNTPLFSKPFNGFTDYKATVWKQVDLARLYVLRECLVHGTEDAAIYADMDVIVPDEAFGIVEQHGMVTNIHPGFSEGLLAENQLFGFSKSRLNFLLSELLPKTAWFIEYDEHNGWRGHTEVFAEESDALSKIGLDFNSIALKVACIKDAKDVKHSYQDRKPSPVAF